MSTDIALPSSAVKRAEFISQATAVEQARAVAEVQAAVIVAQQNPRDIERAAEEMRDACGRIALANRAFYAVPNRGTGPSVHLARELARIWGNIDFGVKELRRDDDAGESEVIAFSWDQQVNTRSSRSFISPHIRMKAGKRQPLTDIGDIYLSNQNVGARAVRECIFNVLPAWFTEEAQDLCHRTLENGEGVPLADRIRQMVSAFAGLDVTLDQLEQKIGRKRGTWTGGDVAGMSIVYTSITRDGLSKDDEFPPRRVTTDEIVKPASTSRATSPDRPGISDRTRRQMFAVLAESFIDDDDEQRYEIAHILGQPVKSRSEVTEVEALAVIVDLQQRVRTAAATTQGSEYDPTSEPGWGGDRG